MKSEPIPPIFFVSTLTDAYGGRHYAACITFHESRSVGDASSSSTAALLEEGDDDDFVDMSTTTTKATIVSTTPVLFKPKCLVLVSRRPYFELFRCCLNQIYYAFLDQSDKQSSYQLETMIAELLSAIYLPPVGSAAISFTLAHGGERLSIRPPLSDSVPLTGSRVAVLFQQLGMFVHFDASNMIYCFRNNSQSPLCSVRRTCGPQSCLSFSLVFTIGRRMLCTHCTSLSVQISVS